MEGSEHCIFNIASAGLCVGAASHSLIFCFTFSIPQVCWDKEDGDVWEAYVARVERGGGSVKGHGSNAPSSDFG